MMAPLLRSLPLLSAAAANLLFASIWQALLLTILVYGCLRLTREVTPAARFLLWAAVLVMVISLPLLSLAVPHVPLRGLQAVSAAEPWSMAVLAIWLVFSTCRAVQLGASAMHLRGLLRRVTPVTPEPTIAALLADGPRPARLCVSEEIERPCVAGFFRPCVILPPDLYRRLSTAELQPVVLHEMEHLRRRDDWVNLLQQISLVLMPLNPVLLWLNQRMCHERELACDDGVLRATRARKVYAACLVRLAEHSLLRRGVSLALAVLGGQGRESEIAGRVRRILSEGPVSAQGKTGKVVTASALAGILAAGMLLAGSPQLVRFSAGETAMAREEAMQVLASPVAGAAEPIRPTLVKASFEPGTTPVLLRASFRPAAHRRRVRRRTVGPARAAALAVEHEPAWQAGAVQGRLVLTSFEFSQPGYAAVLVQSGQDGWLIVQL